MSSKNKLRLLRCWKCGKKKWHRWFKLPAEDLSFSDSSCKCGTLMLVKIRLECMTDGCKKYIIAEGDPHMNNPNFRNKDNEYCDLRNQGYVCPEHYDKHEERLGKIGEKHPKLK